MFFSKNLDVNITLDYIQDLPMYSTYTTLHGNNSMYKYGIPEESINSILDSLGVDIKEDITSGTYLVRSNVDITKAKECTVLSCRLKEDLPKYKEELFSSGMLIPANMVGTIDILSIGNDEDDSSEDLDDWNLSDLIGSQLEDRFTEDSMINLTEG